MGAIGSGKHAATLAQMAPFSEVAESTLAAIEEHLTLRQLAAGEVLVAAGTEATDTYVVVDGRLRVELPSENGAATPIATLEAGAVVGEVALLMGGRRTAEVAALTDATVLTLTKAGFGILLSSSPEVGIRLVGDATRRLRQAQLAEHLERHLGELDEGLLAETLAAVELEDLHAGKQVFAEGDAADAAYIVLSGRLRAERRDGEVFTTVAEVGPGELLGELALLDGGIRTADVVAVRDTALARIGRDTFDELFTRHPARMLGITRRLIARDREPRRRRLTPARQLSVMVVPHHPKTDIRAFTRDLVAAFGAGTLHLSSDGIDRLLHDPGISQAAHGGPDDVRLTHWLHEAELEHRVLVYEADTTRSPWAERASRQADEILIVADAATDPTVGVIDSLLGSAQASHPAWAPRRTLVLRHAAGTDRPRATAAWLEACTVERHVHLRQERRDDLARLGRLLTGEAVGLVLGGGGARGAGHLGAIRALREAGVPIDLYGGTSMGAIMAAAAALEWPAEEMTDRMTRALTGLLDYTLPMVSLLKGKRITRAIEETADGRDLEDLWTGYFCVSTNLTRQEEVVHRRGEMARALRASVAIPGVLPPVPMGDDVLVDGGSMNNLPVDRMRELNPTGTVIAVDVAPPRGPSAKSDFAPVISGWSQVAGRVIPGLRPVRVPGITATMLGSTIVAAMRDRNARVAEGLADLYLDLDLRGHGLLDFEATPDIAAAGYEAASPRIEAWLADRASGEPTPV